MPSDRLTISLDEESREALETLTEQSDESQSELMRRAVRFYAANYDAARTDSENSLEEYYKMLSGGEHALLDIDFLHLFLSHLIDENGENEALLEDVERVADYHAEEYRERFDTLEELLDWLSLCGFLSVRQTGDDTYHAVFQSPEIRWFMTRFAVQAAENLPFDVHVEEGVSKVLFVEESA